MNILSIYFSGTNNTKYVNDKIKEKAKNYSKFDVINIGDTVEDLSTYVFSSYDLIIVGAPVYVEVFPRIFTDFIKNHLANITDKKIIIYQTAGSENPPAIYEMYKFFADKNEIVGLVAIEMPNNFYLNGMFAPTSDEERKTILEKCDAQIENIVEVVNGEKDKYISAKLLKNRYRMGRIVYNSLENVYLKKYAKKNFSSSQSCCGCGVCKNECPTNNISVSKEEKTISFGKECAACMRCINICPFDAILFKGSLPQKYEML